MIEAKPCPTPMSPTCKLSAADCVAFDNATLYRSIVGALQYLTLIRPNISFSVNRSSQFLAAPSQTHWQAVKRVLQYIQGTLTYGLQFTHYATLNLEGFADADWVSNLDDRKSTGGHYIYLGAIWSVGP
ncbi:hypothetical protein ACOSQ3_004645 [Xanthoceras sorbifolium]